MWINRRILELTCWRTTIIQANFSDKTRPIRRNWFQVQCLSLIHRIFSVGIKYLISKLRFRRKSFVCYVNSFNSFSIEYFRKVSLQFKRKIMQLQYTRIHNSLDSVDDAKTIDSMRVKCMLFKLKCLLSA